MIRAGLVGCGQVGFLWDLAGDDWYCTYAKCLFEHPDVQLCFVVDKDAQKAKACSEHYEVPVYGTSMTEVLQNQAVDFLCLATPPQSHFDLLRQALNMGVSSVLCEKPLLQSLEQWGQLQSFAEKHFVSCAYLRRWDSSWREARSWMANEPLGKLVHAQAYYYGEPQRNLVHLIDVLMFCGFGIEALHEQNDGYVAQLNDGARAHFFSMKSNPVSCLDMQLVFEQGRVLVDSYGEIRLQKVVDWPRFAGHKQFEDVAILPSTIRMAFKQMIDEHVRNVWHNQDSRAFWSDEQKRIKLFAQLEQKSVFCV